MSDKRIIMLRTLLVLCIISILANTVSATVIDVKNIYQDSNGNWLKEDAVNLTFFPRYTVSDEGTSYVISRMGESVTLPKRSWISYNFYPDRIVPVVTINSYSQIDQLVTKVNSSAWYLTVPFSASNVRSVTDDLIDMGVFRRTTSISVRDSNTTPNSYYILPKVIGDDIRLYFNPQTYSGVVYPLILTENTITVTNASTSGFTSANVSLNGSRWTGSGQLAINLNASYLNGLLGYWSMDENTGTTIHNVNTESGSINTTNQGTWSGNTTLNYTTGQIGNAGSFDGVDDYVSNTSLFISENNTISVWVKPNIFVNSIGIWSKRGTALGSEFLRLSGTSGAITIWRNKDGANLWEQWTTGNVLSTSSYNNIITVYNGTNQTIYVNGVAVVNTYTSSSNSLSNNSFYIGRDSNTYFNGSIDEVKIWNRALSASEIAELYNRSMRIQAMPLILNQSASAGNVINRTRIVYSGQDTVNNISIYARQNGTTAWNLIQSNISTNTWMDSILSNNLDYGIQMHGNGSNTPFFTSLEYDETPAKIYFGTGLSNNITVNGVQNYSRVVNTSSDVIINISAIPTSDLLNVTINTWNTTGDYYKKWNESSTNTSTTTQHIIGDLLLNTTYQIKRDSINYTTVTSNSTGYINWTYSGGYSEHQFEIELYTPTATPTVSDSGSSGGSVNNQNPFPWTEDGDHPPIVNTTSVPSPEKKSYIFRINIDGISGRFEPPITDIIAINFQFPNAFRGIKTLKLNTMNTYDPSLLHAYKYFEIFSDFPIKTDSSIEYRSSTPIKIYQLYTGGEWIENKNIKKISPNVYKIPISSLGVFTVTTVSSITANQVSLGSISPLETFFVTLMQSLKATINQLILKVNEIEMML
jgi:hypothetical protein